jgi:hypothetical protein
VIQYTMMRVREVVAELLSNEFFILFFCE